MRLATRSFIVTSALVTATVVGLVVVIDPILRARLESEIAAGLERDARLVAHLIPEAPDRWPAIAQELGRRIGRRVTLVAPNGRVFGDTDFEGDALARLENHAGRPEIRGAVDSGVGRDQRRSASNNQRQMYVAVRGGPPGVAVVRVSASLATVDEQVAAVRRAVVWTGLLAAIGAALVAWPLTAVLTRPLARLTTAARQIAAGLAPSFPESRVPEIADHVLALREMAAQLAARIDAISRDREEARTLVESISDGVMSVSAEGRIVTANAAARRLLGYHRKATLPPSDELFHDKRARGLLREAAAGREINRAELRLHDRDLLVTARPLAGGGAVVVLHDVTPLRRLEAVRRDFVANVSHELKTPLTSIVGYAETLAGEPAASDQVRTFTQTILSNAKRMQRLVDTLLDLSRIESGAWRPEPEVVALDSAIAAAWEPVAERARAGDVRLELELDAAIRSLEIDPDALRQILTNLFENAVRHTPGGGQVTVGSMPDTGAVIITVQDTGSGIAAEHLPRIFERFYRVDAGRGRDQGGTGLGLAIVKHLVEAHGGRVEAESGLGQGTTIRLTFPT